MLVVSPSVSVMNWDEGRKIEIAQMASHTTRMETPEQWVKRWTHIDGGGGGSTGERTYQCRERGSEFCSQKGKGNAAQETKQRRNSHEKTNLLVASFSFGFFLMILTRDSSTPEALQKLMVMLSKPRTVR